MAAAKTAGATRLPIDWSATAAKDRLSSTLFLAALFHGILILGVTFGSGDDPFNRATSLDVVLVTAADDNAEAPADATTLAQRNLDGSGNTEIADQLRTAVDSGMEAPAVGADQAGALDPRELGDRTLRQVETVTTLHSPDQAHSARDAGEPEPALLWTALPGDISATEIVNQPDRETLITATGPRELVISADTRESRIAAYLTSWKQKVERVGTLNFPRQAQAGRAAGHPILEVAVGADGHLDAVIIRQSSGQRILDEAAMEIVRLAAPFEAFPDFLRSDYDVLRFAYEWRFSEGDAIGRVAAVQVSK